MNLDHDFVQVRKFSEDQKKKVFINDTVEHFPQIQVKTEKKTSSSKIEPFFPQIQVKTKKKVFIKNRALFPQFSLRCTPIQIIGGIHPNYWGRARSQKFAMGGGCFGGLGAGPPALENFAFFCKNNFILGLF